MSVADECGAALGEAIYLLVRSEHVDPRGRWLAQSFLRNGMGAAIDIAAEANPGVGLLDLLVLGSLQSWALEAHRIPAGIGPAAGRQALHWLHDAEATLWRRAGRVLTAERVATLRELIRQSIAANPDRTVVSRVRFDGFTQDPAVDRLHPHASACHREPLWPRPVSPVR